MRELAILSFVTLDGVMQAPSGQDEDTSGGFARGGWARPWWEEVMTQVGEVAMSSPYDMLLGRKTYEAFAAHWSEADAKDPAAATLNNAKKYVATNTLTDLSWHNSFAISGDVAAGIKSLKAEDGPLLQVHGSQQLIQLLLKNDLVDEYRMWTFPVVVGPGKRLFESAAPSRSLSLVKSEPTENGALMTIYRRSS